MAVDIRHLFKAYGETEGRMDFVIRDFSLQIETGQFVCVLGKSGCGKSTLLNLLAGYLKPDQGEITIDGRQVKGPGADRGVVFQQHALFPWLTVRKNIEFGLRLKHDRMCHQISDEYIHMVDLDGYQDAYPGSLSGGMAQRVGIARALVNDPQVLLMDEPLGALDALTRDSMRREIERIWKVTNKTVVFITHSVPEAVYLADRVIILDHGHAVLDQAIDMPRPRDILDKKFERYVQQFEMTISGNQSMEMIAE